MRNIHRLIITVVVMAFLLAGFSAAFAQEKKAPDVVVLNGAPMGGVKFNHKAHAVELDSSHGRAEAGETADFAAAGLHRLPYQDRYPTDEDQAAGGLP